MSCLVAILAAKRITHTYMYNMIVFATVISIYVLKAAPIATRAISSAKLHLDAVSNAWRVVPTTSNRYKPS